MDITLVNSSLFDVPSSRRIGAMVIDGAADLRLWRGPGVDRDLNERYGGDLDEQLERARTAMAEDLEADALPLGTPVRLYHGQLHCDYLVWVCSRPPEPGVERQPAPAREAILTCLGAALRFAAERHTVRVAVGPFAEGPGALSRVARLALFAEAARAHDRERRDQGAPAVIEEILLCEPDRHAYREARSAVRAHGTVDKPLETPGNGSVGKPLTARKGDGSSKARSAKSASRRKAAQAPAFTAEELSAAASAATPFRMDARFDAGQWLRHAKFGLGRVERVSPDGYIFVRFDGEPQERRLAHAR